jgi:hypothetical protein
MLVRENMGFARMDILTLSRGAGTDQGTPGKLTGSGLSLFTMELPWRDNQPRISRIPAGQYLCSLCYSPAFKKNLYRLSDVPGRSGVLIHVGNWAGDVSLGFRASSQGCIIVGKARGQAAGQLAVLNSADALRALHGRMGGNPFTLDIIGSES